MGQMLGKSVKLCLDVVGRLEVGKIVQPESGLLRLWMTMLVWLDVARRLDSAHSGQTANWVLHSYMFASILGQFVQL